jgi:beta-xylosidase
VKCTISDRRTIYYYFFFWGLITAITDTPIKEDYSITADRNHLRLYGGPYNLSVPACPVLFLRKQQNRSCTWQTRLSFNPTVEDVEAGTVLWWNYFTYSSLGIRKKGNTRVIRFRPAEGNPVDRDICNNSQDVVLVIECGRKYRFGFQMADNHLGDISWIGKVSNQTMTKAPPVGAPFTGMMLGLYAFGERQRCLTPADFHFVEIR